MPGQACSVGVGAFHPESQHLTESAHEREQRGVTRSSGGELLVAQDATGRGVDDRDVVGVGVGINPGHDLGRRALGCHDGWCLPFVIGQARTGRAGRQDVDGTWLGQAPMRSCPLGRRTLLAPCHPGDRSDQRQLVERQSEGESPRRTWHFHHQRRRVPI